MEVQSLGYISYARQLIKENSYNKAFDLFVLALETDSSLVPLHEGEFRSLLLKLNSTLMDSNSMENIFNNFGKAISIYPNNTHLLNDIGKYLYNYGYYKEAWEHFEKVLKINPSYVDAEKNLNSIKNLLVERWHFRMLNDNIRNERYRQAILSAVHLHNDRVIDIGTGTGLLAIYANEAGARKVIGCDGSNIMSKLADNIIRSNKIKNLKIMNKMSTDLSFCDVGGKCSILLTEMFDAGLFGEHVLQMLSHAWPTLLTPEAKIVPNSAEFFVEGVHSDHLIRNYQLCSEAKQMFNICSLNVHAITHDTYDCEDVHLVQDTKYLTEPQSVIKVNFNDFIDISQKLSQIEPYRTKLKVKGDGVINAVIGWFNLYLSESITITTNPRAADRANAWQQAVFFNDLPKQVIANETIHLEFLMNGGKLTMVPSHKGRITRVSSEIIRFLNDTEYMKLITGCISVACVYLGQLAEMSQITLVDLCPFPVFGLMMLKRGARTLLCRARNESDKEFIVQVCKANQISTSKVTIIYGDEWTGDIFGEEKFHAIFTHWLDSCGDVDPRMAEIGARLRRRHLVARGLSLPRRTRLLARLASSRRLDLDNRLYDENVSGHRMADHLNAYAVTQNFCIDFSVLKYVPISDPAVICFYPNGSGNRAVSVPIISDGYANAILCWYSVELMDGLKEISTDRPESFMDGMLFLTNSKLPLEAGKFAKIVQHKDADGCFKLTMEYV